MTQYWNVDDYTYHITIDFDKKKAKISKHDSNGKKDGRTYTVPLKDYEACVSRYDVDALYRSKVK